jgi:RNA polymerase sigma-70 factor, ECF subfamily
MNAVISGRAGLALVIEGESLMSLDVDDLETLVPRSPYDLRFLLAGATDLITLENTGRDEIAKRLDLEHDIACALDMTLIALDPDSSTELRAEAVAALDELLADARVTERLEYTMYAKPLPSSADLMGALFCTEVKTAKARSFFERLDRDQTAIKSVRESWDALPDYLFGDEATAKAEFHDAACDVGLFRLLSLSYADQAKVSVFLLDALENESISTLRNYRNVVQQWCAPIRDAVVADSSVIEHQYDDHEEATETLPPATRMDSPHGQPLDPQTNRAGGVRSRRTLSDSEAWAVRAEALATLSVDPGASSKLSTLAKRIMAGDSAAEEEVVRYYNQGVSIIIDQIVRGRSVTEDLTQDTFKIVLAKVRQGELREPERLSGFVCSVARNTAIDYIRRTRHLQHQEAAGYAEQIPDPAPTQLEEVLEQEKSMLVRQLINELKMERDRHLLFRYYIAEDDANQICADLGLTRSQFNNILYRATKRFKQLYVKHVGTVSR